MKSDSCQFYWLLFYGEIHGRNTSTIFDLRRSFFKKKNITFWLSNNYSNSLIQGIQFEKVYF